MRALFTAATGMNAQQTRTDTIANNIANVNTTGFKKARVDFQDLFYETIAAPGSQDASGTTLPTGIQVGHGVRLASAGRIMTGGDPVNTDQPLDMRIGGEGFFQIDKPTGEVLYSRAGAFTLNQNGDVVTPEGYPLSPNLNIPTGTTDITISSDGTVNGSLAGTQTNIGQIDLVRFSNPAGLQALGGNFFAETLASGTPEVGTPDQNGFGAINQRSLENSNVNVAEELIQLILAQRAFEMNSRVIRAGDEMLQTVGTLTR